jgi:hypothetical protein
MAAGTATQDSSTLELAVYLAGEEDGVVQYSSSKNAYNASPAPKRFVGMSESGHLTFSDICTLQNGDGDNILTIADDFGVCGAQFAGFLFDCDPSFIDGPIGVDIVNYASTAAFEEVLKCDSGAAADWDAFQGAYENVVELLSE